MNDSTNATPLEKKVINVQYNGVWKDVPAIHKTWIKERAFPRYMSPHSLPDGSMSLGAKETWLELVRLLHDDLVWLLGLSHHEFWSQVVFYKPTVIALTSFMQEVPPAFYEHKFSDKDMELALEKTSRLVFLVFCRLTSVKESPGNFISPHALGKILYENYIITVPSLLDICAVYGITNRSMVRTIIRNVLKYQPRYLEDFTMASEHLIQILDNAKDSILSEETKHKDDIVLHVYDALSTIRIFLEICPEGCVIASPQVIASIATFYASTMPILAKNEQLKSIVQKLRVECLRTVRCVLGQDVEEALEKHCLEAVERYLSKVPELLSEGIFVTDYNATYPIEVDLDILVAVFPGLDKLKIDYLLEALASHLQIDFKDKPKKSSLPKESVIVNYAHSSNQQSQRLPSVIVSGVELESLITEVQDILPHLGSAFIETCLKYYDYSTERVIAAVLESKLPPAIEELNWDTEKPPEQINDRRNVFDGDEFDVMSRDNIDKSRVYLGKKPRKYKNANKMLEDKSEISEMKDKFANLGIIDDSVYDDEYDDTYESLDVAAREPDASERSRRQFVTPRVLQTYEAPDEEEDDEDIEDVIQQPTKDCFVQNPEEIRARAEQKRRDAIRTRDVVGRAKGQGQDKQVLVNRDKKNVHKASGANHHRRDRASRKRNQGLIPS